MPLINCKVELKIKWTNHCVLLAKGNDDYDANSNSIIFTIKAQNYMSLLSLYQQKTIKNCQNFLVKFFKDQCIKINVKQKVRITTRQTSIDILYKQI